MNYEAEDSSDEENRRDEFENGKQADNNDNNALLFLSQALKNFFYFLL
jgi:hypothetical protein